MERLCERAGKLMRACKFEPRYDEYRPSTALESQLERYWSLSESDKAMLHHRKVYVQDVCVVCGKIAERVEEK